MIEVRALGRDDPFRGQVPNNSRLKELAAVLTQELGTGWEIHAIRRRPDRFRSGCRA
ncbi:MAG: hypothetical protein L3K07_03905 [Thermoplasmata archaeon]|nr:hypothetical protein [Thermoplasmata archaeon]